MFVLSLFVHAGLLLNAAAISFWHHDEKLGELHLVPFLHRFTGASSDPVKHLHCKMHWICCLVCSGAFAYCHTT